MIDYTFPPPVKMFSVCLTWRNRGNTIKLTTLGQITRPILSRNAQSSADPSCSQHDNTSFKGDSLMEDGDSKETSGVGIILRPCALSYILPHTLGPKVFS